MKVVVLTTSYPRSPDDHAGRFVSDAVDRLRVAGVEIVVVAPGVARGVTSSTAQETFRHYGIAYGAGVAANLRARPARALLLPPMLGGFLRAARRAARGADLVHAHWLPAGAVALASGRPYIVHVHGTDVELAHRAPWLARPVWRGARLVLAASGWLAGEVEALGARQVEVVPTGAAIPVRTAEEADPPHVLFAGRLSPEKGILELVAAADGLPLVVAGDGPLRERVPGALGLVPRQELERLYGRAAVVAVPSRREGFGVVCLEAMAHGRPVVASAVGGLRELVRDGETGLLVPPGDPRALRAALEQLLGDAELRRRLGAAARERAREQFSWEAITAKTLAAYERALAASGNGCA